MNMKTHNKKIPHHLIQEHNLAMAKREIFVKAGEAVPEHFSRRVEIVEAAILRHKQESREINAT